MRRLRTDAAGERGLLRLRRWRCLRLLRNRHAARRRASLLTWEATSSSCVAAAVLRECRIARRAPAQYSAEGVLRECCLGIVCGARRMTVALP